MDKKIMLLNKVGQQIFYNPSPLFDYESLVKSSLGPNTYRGFHKINKNKPGSKEIFEKILIDNSEFIIKTLKSIKSEKALNSFENEICLTLKADLKKNIDNNQLKSFNKLRKPIDILVEHLISMGSDFSTTREKLIQHLFLPLDSQMFQSSFVFSDSEISELNIKRSFTFKDIMDENHYYRIQQFLKEKANLIGIEQRIYFDLIWNDRYKSKGKNLFSTNPK